MFSVRLFTATGACALCFSFVVLFTSSTIFSPFRGTAVMVYIQSQVTHVICEHLPLGKLTQYTSQRRPPHIVHPDWATGSIAQGKRLFEFNYRIPQLFLPIADNDPQPTTGKTLPSHWCRVAPKIYTRRDLCTKCLRFALRAVQTALDPVLASKRLRQT